MSRSVFSWFAISLCIATWTPVKAGAAFISLKFSIDPASPAIDGNITPDDVLKTGPVVHTQGSSLGLQDDFFGGNFDNLNALSYGRDFITNPLFFSVDRVGVGLPGSAVNAQAQPGVEAAAGSVFQTLPPLGGNSLFVDAQQLGLTTGFFGDDLDALELDGEPNPFTYFSIDFFSATNGFGTGGLANAILISSGNGSFDIFAEGIRDIGLDFDDDLDALVLWDVFSPGILNPGIDRALFSLSTFSPSAFTFTGNLYNPGVKGFLSPADVLFTDFTGGFSLWAAAAALGLRPDDEVNALATVPIPEPGCLVLLTIGIGGLWVCRKRRYMA